MPTKKPLPRRARWLALLIAFALAPGAARAGEDPLTLRINDTIAEPGGLAAVVLRTYASRGVGQGQIILGSRRPKSRGAVVSSPFVELEGVVVFSEAGDVSPTGSFDGGTQMAMTDFESPSAAINLADGPLAAFYFRVAPDIQPGEEFELFLDTEGTALFDVLDQSIAVEPRSGILRIRAPGAPYQLAAEGDVVLPGEVAALAVETSELFAISYGEVVFTYDPAFAAGPPAVTMDPRYGASWFAVDLATPGEVMVTFQSFSGSLNTIVPGQLISIDLPTTTVPPGGFSPLALDPARTRLEDPPGVEIPLILAGDTLVLEGAAIFADGFESGDLARW